MPRSPMMRIRVSPGPAMEQVTRPATPEWKSRTATEKSGVSGGSSGASVLSGMTSLENEVTDLTGPNIAHIQLRW